MDIVYFVLYLGGCRDIVYFVLYLGGCHGRDRMVVEFINTYAISAYHQ